MNEHFYNGFIKRAQQYGLSVVEATRLYKQADLAGVVSSGVSLANRAPKIITAPQNIANAHGGFDTALSAAKGANDVKSIVSAVPKIISSTKNVAQTFKQAPTILKGVGNVAKGASGLTTPKSIPLVGTALGAGQAYSYLKDGDIFGAAGAGLSTALGSTGLGSIGAIGVNKVNDQMHKDFMNRPIENPNYTQQAKPILNAAGMPTTPGLAGVRDDQPTAGAVLEGALGKGNVPKPYVTQQDMANQGRAFDWTKNIEDRAPLQQPAAQPPSNQGIEG